MSRKLVFEEVGLAYDTNEFIIHLMCKIDTSVDYFRSYIFGKLAQLSDMVIQKLWGD